uniref:Polymerase (DNA directed) kappa n=1 Tax=Sinocyclocheilus grahami TaxID=75366 RepID=A0A672KT58_SINGR
SGQRVQSLFHQNFVSHGLRVLQVPFGKLQASCHLGRVIVHVDMDTFYAAVEMRDCPELKDKLMAVGSMSMLSTSNYHSIRFGKLCPNLFIVLTNFDKYRAVSAQIFSEYDPHFMPMSLDEACLDITDMVTLGQPFLGNLLKVVFSLHHIHQMQTLYLNQVRNK